MRVEDSNRELDPQFSLAVYLVPKWAYGGYTSPLEHARGRKVFKLDMHAPVYADEPKERNPVFAFGSLAA